MRKLGLSLLLMACSLNTAHAAQPLFFQVGPEVEYVLNVNEPQVLSNIFMWTIKAVCRVVSENESNLLSFQLTRKTGSLNNIPLNIGDSMEIVIHANDKLYITASPGAQVKLTNLGEKTMYAYCSVPPQQ